MTIPARTCDNSAPRGATPDLGLDRRPVLGAFSVAGFPDLSTGADILTAYAECGAGLLEVGLPTSDPWLDGPVIGRAHHDALRAGDGVGLTLETVRRVSARCDTPVVVMSYWSTVQSLGLQRAADLLASHGAAGCLVPDVPPDQVQAWAAAAAGAQISAPLLAPAGAPDAQWRAVCGAATGFIYVPAAGGQRTGYAAGLDLPRLAGAARSARSAAPGTPVLTGIGVSTPALAAAVAGRGAVDGVVVGWRGGAPTGTASSWSCGPISMKTPGTCASTEAARARPASGKTAGSPTTPRSPYPSTTRSQT